MDWNGAAETSSGTTKSVIALRTGLYTMFSTQDWAKSGAIKQEQDEEVHFKTFNGHVGALCIHFCRSVLNGRVGVGWSSQSIIHFAPVILRDPSPSGRGTTSAQPIT